MIEQIDKLSFFVGVGWTLIGLFLIFVLYWTFGGTE